MELKQLKQFTFYDLYAELMDVLNDEERGKLLRQICEYMFTDGEQNEFTDKKLIYLWGNIIDYLDVDKQVQLNGKKVRASNKMRHFTFYRNFFEAVELMDDKQAGQYIKAIYNFALNNIEPSKLVSPVDLYYTLAKRKLELSKVRSSIGKKGGKAGRVKVTDEQINEQTDDGMCVTFDEFMRLHPNVQNDLYASRQHLLKGVDWALLDIGLNKHPEYKKCNSLYQLLVHRKEIIDGV